MISTALFLAVLVTAGFVILFYKLPVSIRRFLSGWYILLDVIICWIVFTTMGFALIGLMAAGFISLFVSIYLYFYKYHSPKPKPKKTFREQIIVCSAYIYNQIKRRDKHEERY